MRPARNSIAPFDRPPLRPLITSLLRPSSKRPRHNRVCASALQPIAETALNEMKEKAAASSHEFAREMGDRSRAHLEFVSSSIAEVAKGIGKLPGE